MRKQVSVGFSGALDTAEAFADAAADAAAGLEVPPDLALVFAGAPHLEEIGEGLAAVEAELKPRELIGCGAGGVVWSGRELEQGAGAVVWAASFPDGEVSTHRLGGEPGTPAEDLEGLDSLPADAGALIVLADPYTFAADSMLEAVNERMPGTPVLGGLASAAVEGSARLLLGSEVVEGGAVAAALRGVQVLPCVSQGATPVGPELAITEAEGNVISELAFKPAAEKLAEVVGALPADEREQAASEGLLVGVTIDENQPEHERGDFLVRPIVGADRQSGALAIGELVRVGQTVRLHLRDAASADADLREALADRAEALSGGAVGALLFTCTGRGAAMFGSADHDALAVEDALGAPLAGFFCAGEIGPVGARNFLHGFTATLAVFPAD